MLFVFGRARVCVQTALCVCVCVRKDLHACVNSVNVRNPAAHPDVRRLMPSRELF